MHGVRKIPKQLGAHRIAAFALYRALLSQCANLPLDAAATGKLQNVVRNRFCITRPQRLRLALAFRAGYTALDLLDASVAGDQEATARITDYLSRIPASLTQWPKEDDEQIKPKDPRHFPTPVECKLENVFPRKEVKGIRKVPYLVNATGLPFIRWKKPQPENVSRVIRSKLAVRNRRVDEQAAIEETLLPASQWEDHWDDLVRDLAQQENDGDHSANGLDDTEAKFEGTIVDYARHVKTAFDEADQKTAEMSKRFTRIVWEEQRLAEQERVARKKAAKARWLSSQAANGAGDKAKQ